MDNNILSESETKFIDKRKGKKIDLYVNERKLIVQKLFNILDVKTENTVKYFYSDDLTEEIQNKIINMKDEIKQYFKVGTWICYKNTVKLDKVHLSIIRYVLKHEKIDYSIVKKTINNRIKTKYIIVNNE